MSCETCRHAEMCRWVDEVGARGCDFEEQAQADNEQKIHHLTDEAYSELCLFAAKGREALHTLEQIKQITNAPVYVQEDVMRYKMICEVIRDDKA